MSHNQYRPYELNFPHKCKICNNEIKSKSGLGSHIKNQHKDYTYKDYLLKFENIDLDELLRIYESGKEDRKNNQLRGLKRYQQTLGKRSPKDRMTPESYKKWRDKMAKVFTLDWFINKYGEELGKEKYKERSKKITKQLVGKSRSNNNPNNWSKISQELFWEIYNRTKFKEVYFGELNHEHGAGTNQNFDFVVVDNKKIIEFNGDKWHANPKIYEENDIIMPTMMNKRAKQIWRQDLLKHNKAIKKGYDIKVVWESDYHKNKEQTIIETIQFLL